MFSHIVQILSKFSSAHITVYNQSSVETQIKIRKRGMKIYNVN